MPRITFLLVIGLAASGAMGQAFGQRVVEKFDRQLQQIREAQSVRADESVPLGRRVLFDYGGYVTPQYLSIQDQSNDTHVLRQLDVVAYASVNVDGAHEIYGRGRFTRQDFGRGDSFDGNGDKTFETVDRLYYKFDLRRALSAYEGKTIADNLVVEAGRQLVDWADGLVLNQVLDGALVGASVGPVDVTGLCALTPARMIDFDSSRPQFDSHTRRLFYGGMAALNAGEHRPYVYFLRQEDHNTDEARATGPVTTRFHYTSYYLGVGSTGSLGDKLSYGAELAYESGHSLSNSFTTAGGLLGQVQQRNDKIEAYAADLRLDYTFPDVHRSRASAEVILATGDRDRRNTSNTFGGNAPGTGDHAFNAFGLLDNGLAFNPNISNIAILRLGGTTFPFAGLDPFDKMQAGVDVFLYGKFSNGAPIDEPTKSSGQFLGGEPDVFLNWQIASDVTLAVRYGIFLPDRAAFSLANPRQFFYTGITFAF